MRYVFVRAINSAFYSYGQWRDSCSYCRDNSTWSPRWTKQIFSLKSSPAEQAFPFFLLFVFRGLKCKGEKGMRSTTPARLILATFRLKSTNSQKKKKTFGSHDLRLITEFMSATKAANLLLSTHGSFTKKREAGTVDLVLGDPFRFQPPLNESEREARAPRTRIWGGET